MQLFAQIFGRRRMHRYDSKSLAGTDVFPGQHDPAQEAATVELIVRRLNDLHGRLSEQDRRILLTVAERMGES
jgi:hypothetical protein